MLRLNMEKVESIAHKYGLLLVGTERIEEYMHTAEGVALLPYEYQHGTIKYQEGYFKERFEYYDDISMIIIRGGVSVGVWPLSIMKNETYKIGSTGKTIVPPLLIEEYLVNNKSKRKIFVACISFLKELASLYHIEVLSFQEVIMGTLSLWHKVLMESNTVIKKVTHQLYFDLSLPETSVTKLLHRTVGQSIKQGYELYDYKIITKDSCEIEEIFDTFRNFHIRISGRETRGINTWNCQKRNVAEENDFVVALYDKLNEEIVGMSLFTVTPSYAYYAVAVYDRDKFDKPVGHMVQDIAIKHLRNLGVKWYVVGERLYTQDDGADAKVVNIGFYKESFATHTFLEIHEEIEIQDIN